MKTVLATAFIFVASTFFTNGAQLRGVVRKMQRVPVITVPGDEALDITTETIKESVTDFVAGAQEAVQENSGNVVESAKDTIIDGATAAGDVVTGTVDTALEVVNTTVGAVANATDAAIETAKDAANATITAVQNAANATKNKVVEAKEATDAAIENVLESTKSAVESTEIGQAVSTKVTEKFEEMRPPDEFIEREKICNDECLTECRGRRVFQCMRTCMPECLDLPPRNTTGFGN